MINLWLFLLSFDPKEKRFVSKVILKVTCSALAVILRKSEFIQVFFFKRPDIQKYCTHFCSYIDRILMRYCVCERSDLHGHAMKHCTYISYHCHYL